MISFALVLTLRSLLLAFLEKRRKLLHLAFACFFVTCFFIIWLSTSTSNLQPLLFLILALLVAATIVVRLKRGPKHALLKSLVFSLFLLFFSVNLGLAGYLRIKDESPLLKVIIPGLQQSGSYLVKLRSVDDQPLGDYSIEGDLVSLRAKIIRTKPFLHFLGLRNLCKVERICGSYHESNVERKERHSVEELALMHPHPLSGFFEKIWEPIFFEKTESLWVKGALMQASFFPLVDSSGKPFQGKFLLTLTESGLSSLALSDEQK